MIVHITEVAEQKLLVVQDTSVILQKNGEQAVRMYRRLKPDFVTMDICMPIMDGLEATKEICTKFPGAKVLICSSVGEVPVYKRQAFANGACGVLPKEYDLDDLEFAISEIELMNEEN